MNAKQIYQDYCSVYRERIRLATEIDLGFTMGDNNPINRHHKRILSERRDFLDVMMTQQRRTCEIAERAHFHCMMHYHATDKNPHYWCDSGSLVKRLAEYKRMRERGYAPNYRGHADMTTKIENERP